MPVSPVNVQIKAQVPAKSTGRLLDALTDIIRPFTERRGLRADQIRFQREEVALKIAEMARKRVDAEKAPVRAIPVKGLVQFLEKASLEDPSDRRMMSMWANLLANAATRNADNLPRHVSILSEMNSAQARLLELTIMHRARKLGNVTSFLDEISYWHPADQIGVPIEQAIKQNAEVHESVILDLVHDTLNVHGVAIISIDIEGGNDGRWHWPHKPGERKDHIGKPENELDFNVMASLGLVTREIFFRDYEPFVVIAYFWRVTYLGFDLFSRCDPDKFERNLAQIEHDLPATRPNEP